MDITCNEDQRLFVFKHDDHVTCLGFGVVFNHLMEFMRRFKKIGISPTFDWDEIRESEIGSIKQYQLYTELVRLAGTRKLGTWFDYDTPTKVRNILEQYRKDGGRLKLFYGDRASGRDWMEENDVMGRIGRSTGTMQIPLLIAEGEYGGPGILDGCIVRMIDADSREELYRQKNYHLPDMEIRSVEGQLASWHTSEPPKLLTELGYTHAVWVREKDGKFANQANFKSFAKAAQYVAFMGGECCEQPV